MNSTLPQGTHGIVASLLTMKSWYETQALEYSINWEILLLLFLPNTDRLQQIEDYVRGCTRQLAKVKTSYKFHKLVFDKGNSTLERLIHMHYGSRFQSDVLRG
jgi:hypothetical protein